MTGLVRNVLTRLRTIAQSYAMRRVAIVFAAALWLAIPSTSRAQYNDNDQQNAKEYHDDDSQPLAIVADILYPIGYGFEWLVARPAHWIANDSPASPVYRPVGGNDNAPLPPIPIIPDNTLDSSSQPTQPQDWSPTRSPVTTNATVIKKVAPAARPSTSALSSQPALH